MIYRIPTHRHPKPEVSLKHVKVGRLRQFQPLGVRGSQETIWVQSQPLVTSPLLLLVTSMTLRVREKAASAVETLQLLQVRNFNLFFFGYQINALSSYLRFSTVPCFLTIP